MASDATRAWIQHFRHESGEFTEQIKSIIPAQQIWIANTWIVTYWLQSFFIFIDVVVLLISLVTIFMVLRNTPNQQTDTCQMSIHILMLAFQVVATGFLVDSFTTSDDEVWYVTIWCASDFVVICIMVFIMSSVN